jgi:hypothetical protein
MELPLLRDISELTPSDFREHPLWVCVHGRDQEAPWYEQTNDQTYRPWIGALPYVPKSPFDAVLVAAIFELADGTTYRGYFNPVAENWDEPLPPRKLRDGSFTKPLQWSARRGGSPLSILSLHHPVIFIDGVLHEFHWLRDSERRRLKIEAFYGAIGKPPADTFPIRYHCDPSLFQGIVEGQLDGFFAFPLDKQFVIDTGENLLTTRE